MKPAGHHPGAGSTLAPQEPARARQGSGAEAAADGTLPARAPLAPPPRAPTALPVLYDRSSAPRHARQPDRLNEHTEQGSRLSWGTRGAQTTGGGPVRADPLRLPSSPAGSEPKAARPRCPPAGSPPPHPPPRPGS